ncbi:magnesium transporter [bacterium]|nr:magnesium transporter [bacterium]
MEDLVQEALLSPDLKRLVDAGDLEGLRSFFAAIAPADAAELLLALSPEDAIAALESLGENGAAPIFRLLPAAYKTEITELLDDADVAELLASLAPDDRADLYDLLPDARKRAALAALRSGEATSCAALARYPDGSAGALMTDEYLAMGMGATAGEALAAIRREGERAVACGSVFVVDDRLVPKGAIPLSAIAAAPEGALLADLAKGAPRRVGALDRAGEVFREFRCYGLTCLPVVDAEERLVGVIAHDDMLAALERDRTAALERFMVIAGPHQNLPYAHRSIGEQYRARLGWLIVLTALGFAAGAALQAFENAYAALMILIFYIPVMAGMGGSAAGQSAATVIRALALRELQPGDALRTVWKEARVGLLLGLTIGVLLFVRIILEASVSHMQIAGALTALDIGIAVGLALAIQVCLAAAIGAGLPFILAWFGADPSFASGPGLAAILDILGLLVYFAVAGAILRL